MTMKKEASQSPNMSRPGRHYAFGRAWVAGALVAALAALGNAQTTIYADDFSGAGGPLNGAAVDVGGETWTAGATFLDNGAVETVVAGGANGAAAWLPFTPVAGRIYTLTVDIENQFTDWIAVGFMPATPPGGDWTETIWSVRHSNCGAYAWMLTRHDPARNDQEGFNGPDTANGAFGGDAVSATAPVHMTIVLDTHTAIWTAEYSLNGASYGVGSLVATANTEIAGVGFSRDRNATAGTGGFLSGFSLVEEIAPLPGTWDGDASALWSVPANWLDDTLPVFTGFSDAIVFAAPNGPDTTLVNDVVGVQLAGISFDSSAPAFTLTGNAIEMTGGVTNDSAQSQELTFDISSSDALSMNAATGPMVLSGTIATATGFSKAGAESVYLTQANNIGGPVTFAGLGSLVLNASGALGDPNESVQLNAYYQGPLATLEFDGGVTQGKTYAFGARIDGDAPHINAVSGNNTMTGLMTGVAGGNRYIISVASGAVLNVDADFDMLNESATQRLMRFEGDGTARILGQLNSAPEGTPLGVLHASSAAGRVEVVGAKSYAGDTLAYAGTIAMIDASTSNNIPISPTLLSRDPNATLDFSGLLGGGIVLASGQTLAGGGSVVGAVTAGAGTTLAPGDAGAGTLIVEDLTLQANAVLSMEVGASGNDKIQIGAGGSLTGPASGVVNIHVGDPGDLAGGTYTLLDWSGAASVVDVQLADFVTDAGTLAIVGNQLQLTITITSLGEVLVSDTGNHRVLKYDVTQFGSWTPDDVAPVFAEGVVGSFQLDSPGPLAKDSAGNVYVAESNPDLQDRVMKLSPAGAYLDTVAEVDAVSPNDNISGTPGYLAVDPTDTYLYMAVEFPNTTANDPNLQDVIYRVTLSGTTPPEVFIPTTDVGGTYILQDPRGLAFGPDGYLYVANNLEPDPNLPDYGSRVLRFDVSGPTAVFLGSLTDEHRDTKGLFYDRILERLMVSLNALNDIWAYNNLTLDYVAEGDDSFEYIYNADPTEDFPSVVFVAGQTYFTDITNDVVRRVASISSAQNAVGPTAGLIDPQGLLVLSEVNPFDFANDGDVDNADVAALVALLAGVDVTTPPVGQSSTDFLRADIDNQGDVDLKDMWAFQRQFTD